MNVKPCSNSSRFSLFSASVVATLLLAGCGGGSNAPAPSNPPPPPSPAATPGESASSLSGKPVAKEVPVQAADPSAMGLLTEDQAKASAADLAARLKAGEEGTTPDPVEDRGLGLIQAAVDSYYNAFQRVPGSLQELVTARYLRAAPAAPTGKKYVISPEGQAKLENAN